MLRRAPFLSLVIAATLALAAPAAAAEPVANPAVEGPVRGGAHGYPWNHTLFPLKGKRFRYTEREYFFSGEATNLEMGGSAPYKTRMLVRLPKKPRDFSGVVLVEWLNVTSQADLETAWPVAAKWLMRHGGAYIGVSAQLAGVCCGPSTLRGWDPERYGSLNHPGDLFADDIFSQAIRALRAPRKNEPAGAAREPVDPMRGMKVRKVIVTGASQSALFLTGFINDGYNRGQIDVYVITRGGGPFDDLSTPVFQLNEEDQEPLPPDNENYVLWEEAGTAHAPTPWWDYITREFNRDLGEPNSATAINAACEVNRGSVDFSSRALSKAVLLYLRDGTLPPSAPRVKRDESGDIVRDEHGLARGGLRQPFVEVPVAFNSSEGCPLYGSWEPWSSDQITALYPTHDDYLGKLRRWTRREVRHGWLLPGDRRRVLNRAAGFTAPWEEGCDPCVAPAGL